MKSGIVFAFIVIVVLSIAYSPNESRDLNSTSEQLESQTFHIESVPGYPINWPQYDGFQQTGKVTAEFNCFGTFGANYSQRPSIWENSNNPPNFVTPPDSNIEYLYGGAFWIGGIVNGDTIVSVGHDGWRRVQEYFPPTYNSDEPAGTVSEIDFIADYSMRCVFTDTLENSANAYYPGDFFNPLNVKVANRSHAWHTDPENNCIIYDVVVTNVGTETINSGYFGLYFDCDIGVDAQTAFRDDLTGTLGSEEIAYIIDNDGDINPILSPATRIFAFKFLYNSFDAGNTNYNWWIGNGSPALDFGPRQRGTSENPFRDYGTGGLGTPEGDRNKYYILSFDEWDYDQIYTWSISDLDTVWLPPNPSTDADFSDGYDTRFLMSIGPFDLMPDSSARVVFTTFTADSVHSVPSNINNLPSNPDTYLSLLNFNQVISNADIADSLGLLLLDPYLPVLGLEFIKFSDSSGELQWDPWTFDDVSSYFLYISEVNLDSLPYPGVVPPWWGTYKTESPILLPETYRFNIDHLNPGKHYVATIAHLVGFDRGELSQPFHFKTSPRKSAPKIPSHHAFANHGGPLALRWSDTDKQSIDYYNIYKFPDSQSANKAFHPFYDVGSHIPLTQPSDSFFVNGKTYYYYTMSPYAVMNADDTVFYDADVTEGDVYVVTSADQNGFESEFTEKIFANVVDEMTRDILVITNSSVVTSLNYTFEDSIFSFYDKVLQGFDYEIYNFRDSTTFAQCPDQKVQCMDWHDFMPFRLVIVDDRLTEYLFRDEYQEKTDGFFRYVSYGGKLAYFGRFRGFHAQSFEGYPEFIPAEHKFIEDFFGIDSLRYGGERYYHSYALPPFVDSLFGFFQALSVNGLLPSVTFGFGRDPFTNRLRNYWTTETPPGVATFKLNDNAESVLTFNSILPVQSIMQGQIVGARKEYTALDTYSYAFGFHLWYMESTDARDLIETIFTDAPMTLTSQTSIDPGELYYFEAFSVDSSYTTIYLGNLSQERNVSEISVETIVINDSIAPLETIIVPGHPEFNGEVLSLKVLLNKLLPYYGPIHGQVFKTFSVSGNLDDGQTIKATGVVSIIGHLRGDFDNDESVNVLDLNLIIGYLFRNQELPEFAILADIVPDNAINILDLTQLVNYIFRDGALN